MQLKKLLKFIRLKREYDTDDTKTSLDKDNDLSFSTYMLSKFNVSSSIITIHLGIDFGTSYTKVCFRQLETEETEVIYLNNGDKFGFIESAVKLDGLKIITPFDENWGDSSKQIIKIDNLKMILLDKSFTEVNYSAEKMKTIVIFFLAKVIQQVRLSFIEQQAELCFNKMIKWSASIGVPVKYFDSDEIPIFQNILNIAWNLSEVRNLPDSVLEVSELINKAKYQTAVNNVECYAVPEVVAAICSFMKSQAAMENIYIFMDIGGGTFDITSFCLIDHMGEKQINILDTQIEPLGIKIFINKYAYAVNDDWDENSEQIKKNVEKCLFNPGRDTHKLPDCHWEQGEEDIKKLVAKAIMYAKDADDKHWFSNMKELHIFLGGGGSESPWYKETINRTYVNRKLKNAGIPQFYFQTMGVPDDFHLDEQHVQYFHRYAVAYGLSCPYEYPQIIGYPRVNPKIDKSKESRKFDYDSIAIDKYGKIL